MMCVENVLVRTTRKRGGPPEEKKGLLSKKRDVSLARKQKKAGRALRPACFHQVTVGKLAVQPFAAIGINFILQDTEVQDLFVSDLAFVLPFPLSQERIESPRNVCSKYRPGLENE